MVCLTACVAQSASALVHYDEGRRTVLGITLLQDTNDPTMYYYVPPYPSVALTPGNNAITVRACDAAGTVGTDALTVSYDATSPTCTITTPTSSPTYSTASTPLSIGGTASDNVGLSQVTWTNAATGASGTASGTTNWAVMGIALSAGNNVITVRARDAAGNTGTDAITVTYDSTAPTCTITTPTSTPAYATTSTPLSLGGTASDNIGDGGDVDELCDGGFRDGERDHELDDCVGGARRGEQRAHGAGPRCRGQRRIGHPHGELRRDGACVHDHDADVFTHVCGLFLSDGSRGYRFGQPGRDTGHVDECRHGGLWCGVGYDELG